MTGIDGIEVKFNNPVETTEGESMSRPPLRQRGTNVKGSKMIRYRCSLDLKLCQQRITRKPLMIFVALKGNLKCLDYRGSIIARLKLKRIDGKAPPGVESAA